MGPRPFCSGHETTEVTHTKPEEFDCKIPFSRSPTADCIAKCKNLVELGIPQRSFGRTFVCPFGRAA